MGAPGEVKAAATERAGGGFGGGDDDGDGGEGERHWIFGVCYQYMKAMEERKGSKATLVVWTKKREEARLVSTFPKLVFIYFILRKITYVSSKVVIYIFAPTN